VKGFAVIDSWQNNLDLGSYPTRAEAEEIANKLESAHLMAHGMRVYLSYGRGQPLRYWVSEFEDMEVKTSEPNALSRGCCE
jgi:hypothetical protein